MHVRSPLLRLKTWVLVAMFRINNIRTTLCAPVAMSFLNPTLIGDFDRPKSKI